MVRDYDPDRIPAVYNVDDIPEHHRRAGVSQQYFRGLDTLVGFTHVEDTAAPSDPHDHPWEQINFVLEGSCVFRVGDERITVSAGDIFVVPPGVPHCAEPPDSSCTICFISPLREDYADRVEYQAEFPRDG